MNGCTDAAFHLSARAGDLSAVEILEVIREDQDRLDRMMDELWEKVSGGHEKLS